MTATIKSTAAQVKSAIDTFDFLLNNSPCGVDEILDWLDNANDFLDKSGWLQTAFSKRTQHLQTTLNLYRAKLVTRIEFMERRSAELAAKQPAKSNVVSMFNR